MDLSNRSAYVAVPGVVLIGVCIALAGSQGGSQISGIPVFALCVGLTFIIQWIVFTYSYLNQTEKYYDLTGSLTYISMTLLAVLLSRKMDARSILLLIMIMIWAGRLGTFLFFRIKKAGKDGRFDKLKTSFIRFLTAWTTQGLWVTFTSSAAWTAITTTNRKPVGVFAIFGFLVWVLGFCFEVMSDTQKNRFRADPKNHGKFIKSGLWSLSRHPNYFGEIILWIGVAIVSLPVLRGWQWVTLISPVFVTVLLTRISGVPLLERRADEKWGGQPDYEAYKAHTPVLIPRLPK
jgi:steroid 5-alpha reductase family enzyme